MAAPSGILPRAYKSGSIIYFEADKSEFVYILKSGRVILTSTKLETGEEVKEMVKQGEFFGVKSALGRYPREETAQTSGDTVVLTMPVAEFERLVLNNVNVVRKMLRVFSNQLRRMVKAERTVLGEEETRNPDVELYHLGEYYLKNGQPSRAAYAFKRYIEYYPDGDLIDAARQNLKTAESGGSNVIAAVPSSPQVDDFGFDSGGDDYDFQEDSADLGGNELSTDYFGASELTSEMDDFLSDDSADLDFSLDDDSDASHDSITDVFEEAERYYEMEDYEKALEKYEKVLVIDKSLDSPVNDFSEQGQLKIGQCQFHLGRLKEAMQSLSNLIQQYPQSPHVKSGHFYMGEIFYKAGKNDKALPYFSKVLNAAPKDTLSEQALHRIKSIQGKG